MFCFISVSSQALPLDVVWDYCELGELWQRSDMQVVIYLEAFSDDELWR